MLPGSIATPVKKLKLMTYTAYKNGWIAVNPFAGFYVKAEYSERRYLSASELQAVMNVKLPNYRTSISGGLSTDARRRVRNSVSNSFP